MHARITIFDSHPVLRKERRLEESHEAQYGGVVVETWRGVEI